MINIMITLPALSLPLRRGEALVVLVGLVGLVVFLPPAVQAVEGTLELKADVASFSGTLTQAGNQPIRTAFGPLRLDYKSGPNAWTTGLLIREGDGNVTIGAGITSSDFAATSKLRVLGTVESTTGGFKFPDGTTQTTAVSATAGLAQGAIIFYDGTSCPTGYAEVTGARGRYIVGLPAAGTLAGTAGTALSNIEDRPVGQHLHSVDPANTSVSISDPGHSHSIVVSAASSYNGVTKAYNHFDSTVSSFNTGSSTTGITASVDIAAFNSANSGSVAGTNAPYVQYIVCKASDGAGSAGNGWNDLGTTIVLATSTDSVGIGTTSVTSKLTVAGTVESTTGGFKFPDGSTQTAAAAGETSGQIAFFAAACPSGWTEYTALRGRVVVGAPLSGTVAGTVGTALTNLQDPTHTHTGPSHTHTYTDVIAHSHRQQAGNDGNCGDAKSSTNCSNNIVSTNTYTANTGVSTGTTAASGTGVTSATSATPPYIQLTACQKN